MCPTQRIALIVIGLAGLVTWAIGADRDSVTWASIGAALWAAPVAWAGGWKAGSHLVKIAAFMFVREKIEEAAAAAKADRGRNVS